MPNQLKRDPTRTALLRRKCAADMTRRFKKVSRAIQKLVVEEDAFGLVTSQPMILQAKQAWRFRSNANKVKAYRKWLQQQIDADILTPIGGVADKPWLAPYIESSYKKGALRAYTDTHREALAKNVDFYEGGQEEFLRGAFGSPEALGKIELLYTRAFDELKGVTDAMGQQMSRILASGLAQGQGPAKIARDLRKNVSNITKTRANVLARTEIVRAHAEGQLDSFERLGVKELGLMAEWSTAGDDMVCAACGELEGQIMTVEEARGMLPLHPNCRCAWIPYLKSPKKKVRKGRVKKKVGPKAIRVKAKKVKVKDVHGDYEGRIRKELERLSIKYPKASRRLAGVEVPDKERWKKAIGKNVRGRGDCYAVATPVSARKDAIYLNPKFFGSRTRYDIDVMIKSSYKGKWTVASNVEGLIDHEFGHLVAHTNRKSMDKLIDWYIYAEEKEMKLIGKQISKYANHNLNELLAESFTQAVGKGKTSPMAKKFLKMAGVKI